MEHLLSLIEVWPPASSLTNFKHTWKTTILLAFVTATCSGLTFLCINNQCLFLQNYSAIFVPVSGGEMDYLGHLQCQTHIESYSSISLCPAFYLKTISGIVMNPLGRSWMNFECPLLIGNNRQLMPVCAQNDYVMG